jgi:hypothetical protein
MGWKRSWEAALSKLSCHQDTVDIKDWLFQFSQCKKPLFEEHWSQVVHQVQVMVSLSSKNIEVKLCISFKPWSLQTVGNLNFEQNQNRILLSSNNYHRWISFSQILHKKMTAPNSLHNCTWNLSKCPKNVSIQTKMTITIWGNVNKW